MTTHVCYIREESVDGRRQASKAPHTRAASKIADINNRQLDLSISINFPSEHKQNIECLMNRVLIIFVVTQKNIVPRHFPSPHSHSSHCQT